MKNIGNTTPRSSKEEKPTTSALDQASVDFPSIAVESTQANVEKNEKIFLDLYKAIVGLKEDIAMTRKFLTQETGLNPTEIGLIRIELVKRIGLLAAVSDRAQELLNEITIGSESLINLHTEIDDARREIFSGDSSGNLPS